MRTRIVKWFAIASLLLAVIFWDSAPGYQLALNVVVSVAAAIIAVQAAQARKYAWAAGFLGLALLFNPAAPVFGLSGGLSLWLVLVSVGPFAFSLGAMQAQPQLSIPSITGRTPGSQSL